MLLIVFLIIGKNRNKFIGNVSYGAKVLQLCFEYKKGSDDFGELLNIGGASSKTLYEPKNIHQLDEIERFLNFAEAFRVKLEQRGWELSCRTS